MRGRGGKSKDAKSEGGGEGERTSEGGRDELEWAIEERLIRRDSGKVSRTHRQQEEEEEEEEEEEVEVEVDTGDMGGVLGLTARHWQRLRCFVPGWYHGTSVTVAALRSVHRHIVTDELGPVLRSVS
ncbi:unnamed protein product [Pleuronectes platessa]|uniref:Uncharacterized protein n=1 Tax=Pleuronectes platessa TaxID=8262 RepID=A0A9N7VXG9_PLEPL|nr:unnamed protein product [Pleuronectes platessa]